MASPTFAANSPNAVKFEISSSAATPRASIAIPTPVNQSGTTTPRVVNPDNSTVHYQNGTIDSLQTKEQDLPVSLFDPTHLPSLYGRIQRISKYVLAASEDANSLSINNQKQPSTDQQQNGDAAEISTTIEPPSISVNDFAVPAPNIALGATTDDDINSGYETALSMSFGGGGGGGGQQESTFQPTELAKSIVRESVDLRKAFNRAQKAIESFDGGDMDLEEQQHLISLLEQYSQEQNQIRQSFIVRAGSLEQTRDSEMVDV